VSVTRPQSSCQASTHAAASRCQAHRQLIMMDYRGTGQSATPAEVASYRCDRLVDDVEVLRAPWP